MFTIHEPGKKVNHLYFIFFSCTFFFFVLQLYLQYLLGFLFRQFANNPKYIFYNFTSILPFCARFRCQVPNCTLSYAETIQIISRLMVEDFHSLLVMVQICFSFMLTDKDTDMHMCRHCSKAFIASRKGNEFCSQRCKNQYNIYKSREKKKGNKKDD